MPDMQGAGKMQKMKRASLDAIRDEIQFCIDMDKGKPYKVYKTDGDYEIAQGRIAAYSRVLDILNGKLVYFSSQEKVL